MARVLSLLILVAAQLSCATSDEKSDANANVVEANGSIDDVAAAANNKSTDLKEEQIAWHKFFMPPPNPTEFANIKRKLITWPEPKSESELLAKSRSLVAISDLKAAEALYRRTIRLHEASVPAHVEISQVYLKMGDLDRCFSYLKRAKEILDQSEQPNKDDVFHYRYTLALSYIKQRNEDEGHKILSELISLDKSFTPAYAAMASSYFDNNKIDIAEFIAKRGIDRGKEDPVLINLLGVIETRRGNHPEAKRWFDRALTLMPHFVPGLVNRANYHLFKGDYMAAEQDLELAIATNPIYTEAFIIRGILQKRQGQFKASEASFKKAIDLDPESGYARYNLAVLKAEALKESGEALRLFNEVLQVQKSEEDLRELAKLNIESLQQNRLEYND